MGKLSGFEELGQAAAGKHAQAGGNVGPVVAVQKPGGAGNNGFGMVDELLVFLAELLVFLAPLQRCLRGQVHLNPLIRGKVHHLVGNVVGAQPLFDGVARLGHGRALLVELAQPALLAPLLLEPLSPSTGLLAPLGRVLQVCDGREKDSSRMRASHLYMAAYLSPKFLT